MQRNPVFAGSVAAHCPGQPQSHVCLQYKALWRSRLLPAHHRDVELVERIGRRIVLALPTDPGIGYIKHLAKCRWEFVVVSSSLVNAFVAPGGKVIVHTGSLVSWYVLFSR